MTSLNFVMHIITVYVLFLIKLRWPRKKSSSVLYGKLPNFCNYINFDCVVFSDSINPLTMRIFAKILPLLVGVFLIALLSLNFVFKVRKGLTEIAVFSDSQRFVLRPPAIEASMENDGELKLMVKK